MRQSNKCGSVRSDEILNLPLGSGVGPRNSILCLLQDTNHIAKRFQCGFTKAGYVGHSSLAPYFHKLMLPKLSDCPYVSLSFDEYLNSSVQKGHMNIIIQFWDLQANCVTTCHICQNIWVDLQLKMFYKYYLLVLLNSQRFCRLLQAAQK